MSQVGYSWLLDQLVSTKNEVQEMDVNHLSVPRNYLHAHPKEEKDGRELFEAQASSCFFFLTQ